MNEGQENILNLTAIGSIINNYAFKINASEYKNNKNGN